MPVQTNVRRKDTSYREMDWCHVFLSTSWHSLAGAVCLFLSAFLILSNLTKMSLKVDGVTNDSPSFIVS